MNEFCHLHCHDEYSLLDGYGSPEAFAKAAKVAGQTHIAITNHGNIDSALKLQKACAAHGITPIFGSELYIVEDVSKKERGEKRSHLTVLVQNETGWKNLLKMMTLSHTVGQFYRPRVDPKIVLDNCSGLVFMSACSSSLIHHRWGVKLLRDVGNAGCPVMAEIMPHDYDVQRETNQIAVKLALRYGWPIVATNDCHYPAADDSVLQEIELAIQSKKKWSDPTRWKFSVTGLYVKTREEMKDALLEAGLDRGVVAEGLNNTMHVASLCSGFSKIPQKEVRLPSAPSAVDADPDRVLKDMCDAALWEKFNGQKAYAERLREELLLIFKQNFSQYFLIVEELVRWCKENDIMVGPGRGSSGGSLVCYLLGITMVDPIKYKLLFARFISPSRIDLPDIDIDFEDRKRHLIFKHLSDLYGHDCVAGVSTYSTMGGRGVVRDVSRVFDIPIAEVNTVCKSIVPKLIGDADRDQSVSEAFSETEDGKNFCEKYPDVSEYAARMEGTVRGRGQHAAGTIISADSLYDSDKCYIIKGKDDHPLVNWDKKEIEAMGLMKLDVLGLSALTILSDILERIRFGRGKTIKLEDITFDDPKVFDGFTKGNSVGCFQFGSSSFRKYCGELIVDDFNTIVHATSLWRPGPLQSGQAFEVIEYKHKRKRIPKRHPILREITKTSYGILLYQEQIMQVVNQLAGLSWEVADEVRKAIAKSQGAEKLMTFRDAFVAGCLKMETLDEDGAVALWDQIVSFGKYGFNLSHAVEYSVISYWDMYFKINYPLEFYAASLTFCGNDTKDNLVQDAMKNGVDVRPPKIGISGFDKWVIFEDRLYCPFSEIFGIGPKTAEALQKFKIESREDVKKRLPRFAKIFEECRCYDDVTITDEEAEQIGGYFQFSFSRNAAVKFKRLEAIIKQQDDYDPAVSETRGVGCTYFGYIEEAKLGHSKTGGMNVRASLRDMSGSSTMFFGDVRESKKDKSEHIAEKIIIAKGMKTKRGAISCGDFWDDGDITTAQLKGLQVNFLADGQAIILTESPRKPQDDGFDFLDKRLVHNFRDVGQNYYDLKYLSMLNRDGTANKDIEQQLVDCKPVIIFVLGAKALAGIAKEKMSITDLTGTTVWDKNRQCWLSFGISQASIFYNPESNMKLLEEAVDNFTTCLKNISGLR